MKKIFLFLLIIFYLIINSKDTIKLNTDELEVYNLINEYRKENKLSNLKLRADLNKLAKIKANDLAKGYYFEHTSPKYGSIFDMMKENNIYYSVAGENLAGNISSEKAVTSWINSKTHKDNILTDYTYTGISVIEDNIYGKVFVQIFLK